MQFAPLCSKLPRRPRERKLHGRGRPKTGLFLAWSKPAEPGVPRRRLQLRAYPNYFATRRQFRVNEMRPLRVVATVEALRAPFLSKLGCVDVRVGGAAGRRSLFQ
jgi:hypothetical protein